MKLKFDMVLVITMLLLVKQVNETSNEIEWKNGTCTFLGAVIKLKDGKGGSYTSSDIHHLCEPTERFDNEDLQCKKCPNDGSNCCRHAMPYCLHNISYCEERFPPPATVQPTTTADKEPTFSSTSATPTTTIITKQVIPTVSSTSNRVKSTSSPNIPNDPNENDKPRDENLPPTETPSVKTPPPLSQKILHGYLTGFFGTLIVVLLLASLSCKRKRVEELMLWLHSCCVTMCTYLQRR